MRFRFASYRSSTAVSQRSARDLIRSLREVHPHNGYLAYHSPRYATVIRLLEPYWHPGSRILDIGRSHLTGLIASSFNTRVDSLGFEPDGDMPGGRHYHFDLNHAQWRESWRADVGEYDFIIMAEVIEHLHTAPSLVLLCIRHMLRAAGILILQTPNAAALHKRLKLLLGRNPYEAIREDLADPGHFREYTRQELIRYAENAGFSVEGVLADSYFDYRYRRHGHDRLEKKSYLGLANFVARLLPSALKPGITLVLRAAQPAPDRRFGQAR